MSKKEELFNFIDSASKWTSNNAEKISNAAANVTEAAGTVSNIKNLKDTYLHRQERKQSGELERYYKLVDSYNKKCVKLTKTMLAIWAGLIIITIILCITGNDIVLTFLHL